MSSPKLKTTSPNRKLDTYASAAKEIEQEKQMVAALKRLSIGHLMQYDPDLPGLDASRYPYATERSSSEETHITPDDSSDDTFSSVSSLVNRYSYSELNYADQDIAGIVDEGVDTSDNKGSGIPKPDGAAVVPEPLRQGRPPSFVSDELPLDPELLWVPANMHPEINPQLYKTHVRATIDDLLEQKISRTLSRSRSKRSSLLFSVTDTDPDDATVFAPEDEHQLTQEQPKKQFTNPSLRELTSELQAMSRLAGMDATDAVTLARTLSSALMGYSDVEKLAFDELGNPQQVEKSMYQLEHPEDAVVQQNMRRAHPKLRINTGAPSQGYSGHPSNEYVMTYNDGNSVRPRELSSPVDEQFSLRRSRRPHYHKGPSVPTSQQLSAQQLGSQLQSNKAGKLAVLRQSLLSSNIANVPTQQRSSEFKGNAAAIPPRDPMASKKRIDSGQSGIFAASSPVDSTQNKHMVHSQNRNASGTRYRSAVPQSPYVQSTKNSNHLVPLSPSDSAYFSTHLEMQHGQRSGYPQQMGSLPVNQRSMDSNYNDGWSRQFTDYDDRRNVKMRSMSSNALYGYNPNWQNVPMRSSSDLYSNSYHSAGLKAGGRYGQFDYNGYPIHPQQQQQPQQQYYDHHQQSYQSNEQRHKNRHYHGPYNQYAYPQQQQQQNQGQGLSQKGYYGAYGPEQYSYYGQGSDYVPEQGAHSHNRQHSPYNNSKDGEHYYRQNEYYNILPAQLKRQVETNRRDKASKTHETRRELSENLDLLRNEINEFKESLSRAEPTAPAATTKEREPERERSIEPTSDYSFDLTTHEVSYEDSLGIEKELISERDIEQIVDVVERDVERNEEKPAASFGKAVVSAEDERVQEKSAEIYAKTLEMPIERSEDKSEERACKDNAASVDDTMGGTEVSSRLHLLEIPERSDSRRSVSHTLHAQPNINTETAVSPSSPSTQLTHRPSPEQTHYMGSGSSIREAKEVIVSPIIKPRTEASDSYEKQEKKSVSSPHFSTSNVQLNVHRKSSSGLLNLKTDHVKKKTSKKPWPWSKDKSSKETNKTETRSQTTRSTSSPDLSSKLRQAEPTAKDVHAESEAHSGDGSKDNVISKLFKKNRSHSSSGERTVFEAGRRRSSSESVEFRHDQRSSRSSEDLKPLNTTSGSSAENVKSRLKQKLKNITKGYDKLERTEEPVIIEEPAAEERDMNLGVDATGGAGGDDTPKPMSTLEVQDRLKKSIKRTSRANQPIEFTDSAFGFPLPPPSHSTLVMIDYRFPVHVERAIYRLSHLKLANPKRSLREQVLLSNFMYAYLNLVDHTLHLEQMTLEDGREYTQPDTEMDLLGQQDIDTEFEAESLDEEDFDLIKIDLEIRDQILV